MFFAISFTFTAPYNQIISNFFMLMLYYMVFSLMYFSFSSSEEDRQLILKMWKIYFSILSIMFILIYSMDGYIRKTKIDYYKTKLTYELRTKADQNILKATFKDYEELSLKPLEQYKPQDVNISNYFNPKTTKTKHKPFTVIYGNFAANAMLVITLFMFLWSFTELSYFRIVKKPKKVKSYRKNIRNKN